MRQRISGVSGTPTLIMEAEGFSETLDFNSVLTPLIARECFIAVGTVLLILLGKQIKEHELDMTCSMHGRYEKCKQNFSLKCTSVLCNIFILLVLVPTVLIPSLLQCCSVTPLTHPSLLLLFCFFALFLESNILTHECLTINKRCEICVCSKFSHKIVH
jgi:hypothetical protein